MRYGEARKNGAEILRNAHDDQAESDCDILFFDSFKMNRSAYFFRQEDEILPDEENLREIFFERINRRASGEPVQYITGNQQFMGLYFKVDPRVLIPRLDTEVLADEILQRERGGSVLDMCTGSGCIAVSLKKLGHFDRVCAADVSADALDVAALNAMINEADVEFYQGDLFDALKDGMKFDIIVSNPPYISYSEKDDLDVQVKDHEPGLALFAQHGGLEFYERITRKAPGFLRDGGRLYFEIGCTQAGAVEKLMRQNGFEKIRVTKDLAGLCRVVSGCLSNRKE